LPFATLGVETSTLRVTPTTTSMPQTLNPEPGLLQGDDDDDDYIDALNPKP